MNSPKIPTQQNRSPDHKGPPSLLWLLPVIPVLLIILYSYIFDHWGWGLMDDWHILDLGLNFQERLINNWNYYLGRGIFRPVWVTHCAFFYSLFEKNPSGFYFFKFFEIIFVLLIWSLAAYRITKAKISILLFATITLSFHYFYDVFFYLSSQEILGLCFIGLAVHFFLNNLRSFLNPTEKTVNKMNSGSYRFDWPSWSLGVISLLCAFWSKETFVSCGFAFGFGNLFLAWHYRKTRTLKAIFVSGLLLILFTLLYALFLFLSVKVSYTSSYQLNDLIKIKSNFLHWVKKDFLNHIPWLAATILILFLTRKQESLKNIFKSSIIMKWGLLLSVLLYGGFLLILLPWNTVAYYAGPLGVFFALFITVLISTRLPRLNVKIHIFGVVFATMLNLLVCQYALTRESTYHYDTSNLIQWFVKNSDSHKEKWRNGILCNSWEASEAIPSIIHRNFGLRLNNFYYSNDPDYSSEGKTFNFFLASPRFHNLDEQKLKDWEIIFLSKFWIMYSRTHRGH